MQHLDDGVIQELVDGEIPSRDLPPLQAHLAGCEACKSRLEAARMAATEADDLLLMLDEVEPEAAATAPMVVPIRTAHWSRNLAWAASLLLAAGLGFASRDVILPVERGMPTDRGITVEPGKRDTELTAPANLDEERSASRIPRSESTEPDAPTGSASRAPRPESTDPDAPPGSASRVARPDQAAPAAAPPTAALGTAAGAAQEGVRQSVGNLAETEAARDLGVRRREGAAPTAAFDRAAPAISSQRALSDAAKSMVAARPVDLPTAMRTLGGSIKLIDGMVPTRLDAVDDEVLVVYRVTWGEILLSQRRAGDRLEWHLTGPPGLPADSLAVLRGKVRP